MSKPTWKMSTEELARVWAAHYGLEARAGGWLYYEGKPIVQGYHALGKALVRRRLVQEGAGVDWATVGLLPGGVARVIRGIAAERLGR